MKKIIAYILPAVCAFLLFSCETDVLYKEIPVRADQIAFDTPSSTQRVQINTTSLSIPINLISYGPLTTAINADIHVSLETTCIPSVTVPATATIASGATSTNFTVNIIDYNALANTPASGTVPNRLLLDLSTSTPNIEVAAGYKRVTILLNKILPELFFDVTNQQKTGTLDGAANTATFEGLVVKSAYSIRDTQVTLDIDATLVADYNTKNELTGSAAYQIMPAATYTLPPSVSFGATAGSSSSPFNITVNTSSLSSGKYLIPMIIKTGITTVGTESRTASINSDRDYLLLLVNIP